MNTYVANFVLGNVHSLGVWASADCRHLHGVGGVHVEQSVDGGALATASCPRYQDVQLLVSELLPLASYEIAHTCCETGIVDEVFDFGVKVYGGCVVHGVALVAGCG